MILYSKIIIILLFFCIVSCDTQNTISEKGDFNLIINVEPISTGFSERVYSTGYKVKMRLAIPDTIRDVYQIKAFGNQIFFNDNKAIYSADLNKNDFELVLNPSKGRGPNEITQVFRFDTDGKGNFAISGFPENRIMLFNQNKSETSIIETFFNTSVLVFDNNVVGFSPSHISDNFFTNYSLNGDSLTSYGNYFNNQYRSQGIFDMYWDYNNQKEKVVIGFMYVGYLVILDQGGDLENIFESIQFPGRIPRLITQGDYTFMEDLNNVITHLSTHGDEVHLYSAKMTKKDGIRASVIDVINLSSGKYSHSYTIDEEITWPFDVINDSTVVTINNNFELVVWEKY